MSGVFHSTWSKLCSFWENYAQLQARLDATLSDVSPLLSGKFVAFMDAVPADRVAQERSPALRPRTAVHQCVRIARVAPVAWQDPAHASRVKALLATYQLLTKRTLPPRVVTVL